ncbi:hypothetical protein [Aeromicrobium sp. Sec7.5]|uniref:hypothetical protein n=1 Tax=Aeromicrobium sp. Sec7.5 TaxID=3121276 RepID=UPI002FE43B01
MSRFTEAELRATARTKTTVYESSERVLRASAEYPTYDVFLSHARIDADLILGIKVTLEKSGNSVYVDWIDDPHLDRANVSAATAATLQRRMNQSRSLIYATSPRSSRSVWMPWELGYFNGIKSAESIAILPIEGTGSYPGQEFVGLYPLAEKGYASGTVAPRVVITRGGPLRRRTKSLDALIAGADHYRLDT